MNKNKKLLLSTLLLIVGVLALFGSLVIFKHSSSIGPLLGLPGTILVPLSLIWLSESVKSPTLSNFFKSIIVILLAVAMYQLIIIGGAFSNLDTSGEASRGVRDIALIVGVIITLAGLVFVNRRRVP